MIGIYKITNRINGKSYIGQSIDIEKRWNREIQRAFYEPKDARIFKEYDSPKCRAFRKYGIENFTFEVLEECKKSELNQKERYYIHLYNTITPYGYNLTLGGESNGGVKLNIKDIYKIAHLLRNTTKGNQEIAKMFGVSENVVCGINTGYYWKMDNIEYPIRKREKENKSEEETKVCPHCGKKKSPCSQHCNMCANSLRVLLNQTLKHAYPDPIDLLKQIQSSSLEAVAEELGVTGNAVKKFLIRRGFPGKAHEIKQLNIDELIINGQ